jgi:hypothetical protein
MNQGAESILSFLVSLLAVIENYAILDEIGRATEVSPENTLLSESGAVQQSTDSAGSPQAEGPASIKGVSAETKSKKNQVEELA